MNMLMLAEIDLSGIFCLAAIPCLIIAIMAFRKGFFSGIWLCFVVFMAFMFYEVQVPRDIIYNSSKTKSIKHSDHFPRYESGCIYRDAGSPVVIWGRDIPIPSSINDREVYIPEKELREKDGVVVMISTDRPPVADDYYLYDMRYRDKKDIVPKWLYSSTAPLLIFGIGSAPCILLMLGFLSYNKSKG